MSKPKPYVRRVIDAAESSGPVQANDAGFGLYLNGQDVAALRPLMLYAEKRLDSGKASQELRDAESIIRMMTHWTAIVAELNAGRGERG